MDSTVIELQNINKTLKEISNKMPKGDHPFIRVLVVIGLFASSLGILHAIDIVKNWLGG